MWPTVRFFPLKQEKKHFYSCDPVSVYISDNSTTEPHILQKCVRRVYSEFVWFYYTHSSRL